MKHLGLVQIILILGMGALMVGIAAGALTASQSLTPPSTELGQTATVTVYLTNDGQNPIQALVRPSPLANAGEQGLDLYPGITKQVSYTLSPPQSGSYLIESYISYAEGGAPWRSLVLQDAFTISEPRPEGPGLGGQQSDVFPGPGGNMSPKDDLAGQPPDRRMPGEVYPTGGYPGEAEGENQSGKPPVGPEDGFGGQPGPMGQ